MIVRKTGPDETGRVNALFAIAFEQPAENGPASPDNQKIFHYAAFEDDDRTMMSTISVSEFSIHFDGKVLPMGGVGAVASLPQYRRRGGIRACFEGALSEMRERGYAFSYLYPFSTAYYRRFGYETCVQKLSWSVDLTQWQQPSPQGTWRLAEPEDPCTEQIRALDLLWEKTFNMMVCHEIDDYGWTKKCNPAAGREFTYVCFDGENQPKAYTTFQTVLEPDGRNIRCSRFCFDGRTGFDLLMGLFRSMASDHHYVKFSTPMEASYRYFAPEWSLGAVSWQIFANAGMVRVIDVQKVLESARYRGSGQVVLHITDAQIVENSGSFLVAFAEDRAVRVEKTALAADAELSIAAFSALIAGVSDFDDACGVLSGVRVVRANADLARVFYRKKQMIVDYF